jgi:hypothetical protein
MTYIVRLVYKKSEKENFEMEFETAEPLKQFLINMSNNFIDVDLDGCGKIDDKTFVGLTIINKEEEEKLIKDEEEIKEENNQQ